MDDIKKDPFEEYIKNLPPTRKEMGQAWSVAIGLQDVDGLKPSNYLYCSEATVKRTIQTMTQKGLLRRIGSNKTGEWIINEP